MKRHVPSTIALALLACCLSYPSPSGAARDGGIGPTLKERLQQRQVRKAAPAVRSDTTRRITQPGDHVFTIQHDGLTRSYRIHVPASYDPATPAAMLVALHGGGGNMDYQANDANYGLITKSDREGFIAVFPNGSSRLRSGKFATWNAGHCCGSARDRNVDDVGFIRQVVANLARQMNIDRDRIYATGMSNGGLMAYRLACEASDVFKAIVPVAGTDNTRSCTPDHPVAVLHIHARNDTHVLFDGGAGPGTRDASQVTGFASVPDTVSRWVRLNGCEVEPRRVLERPGAYCEAYSPCRGDAEVRLCVTETGGHSWPGGRKPRADEPPSQALSAVDVMWDFFERR